jgi:hypothetical protein
MCDNFTLMIVLNFEQSHCPQQITGFHLFKTVSSEAKEKSSITISSGAHAAQWYICFLTSPAFFFCFVSFPVADKPRQPGVKVEPGTRTFTAFTSRKISIQLRANWIAALLAL